MLEYNTIEEIYAANEKIREKLKRVLSEFSEEQMGTRVEGEEWTIREIVEHLAIVEDGMTRICAKLLRGAQKAAAASAGEAKISESFKSGLVGWSEKKIEAPDLVRPTGRQSVAESLAKMDENRARLAELRPLFETVDCSGFTFPHPTFGDLTAHDWLALLGGHEHRHIGQIKRVSGKW